MSRIHIHIGNAWEMKNKGLQLLRMRQNHEQIVIFDIDDTLLDARHETGYFLRPIAPILQLCKAAESCGMYIVIITARPDSPYNRSYTERELAHHGIRYNMLYMCPPSVRTDFAYFKKLCRLDACRRLAAHPLFSVGDREWDMGEYGGVGLWIMSD